ncbi:division/cell wall cluster transcriptional repressor MraZ [Portibacter marinus]|uniref:division/cell wall cluster transcriptional repressor MraZ n=1 Tax=Portibacter marinus TaxID=2898660 RepID=UPI001F2896D5|nr:division/cell wall cluster transcriptional repressor MraZ [Portibacter marinus]
MYTFTGEYEVKIDAKGRVRLPSALLKQIGEGALNFVVNRGFEKHLMMYPSDVWEKKTTEINQLNIYNTKQRRAMRYFYRGATKISTDSAERILLPKSLVEYAGIEKEAVLFAYHEQIEIWSKDAYDEMLNSEPDNFAEIADEIFGNDNNADDQV